MAYAILKTLILPPGLIIVLLVLAFFVSRGLAARLLIFVATALLTVLSLPIVGGHLLASLEPYPALITEAPLPADARAIVVLASEKYANAPEYGGDTVGQRTLARVRYGAYLAKRTGLPLYVTGGGWNEDASTLGDLMAKTLEEELGVRVAGIEDRSTTTRENAKFTVPMLRDAGIDHALLVTHAWHMSRAMEAFQREGLTVTAAPTIIKREIGKAHV